MADPIAPDRRPSPLHPARPLDGERDAVIARLQDAFGEGLMDVAQLEERLELAETARRPEELAVLVDDLPTAAGAPAVVSTPAASASERQSLWAVFGGTERRGRWRPPREIQARAVMGGVVLDFREAELEPGSVTDVHCVAVMGGVEVTVPPTVRVEGHGFGLMGGFEVTQHLPEDPSAPMVRVRGVAAMGGVEVKVMRKRVRRGLRRGLLGARRRGSLEAPADD